MAEAQKNPPQDPTINPDATKATKGDDSKAAKAQEKAEKLNADAVEARMKAAEAEAEVDTLRREAAQERVKKLVEAATEEGDPETPEEPARRHHKFTDDGLTIGLDGKNPVSNENPDPLAVRGTIVL